MFKDFPCIVKFKHSLNSSWLYLMSLLRLAIFARKFITFT